MPLRIVIIIVLGLMAYACMLPTPFRVMDDRISIIENPAIKSTTNIPSMFKEGYFHDQSYYRPLINLSFMAEYQAFRFNSFFYNCDNLILHILNALLVFLLVSRLLNNQSIGFWTGVLFVIHPVQWEAICNVPGRSILLSAFFVLSSFVLLLEYYKSHRQLCLLLLLPTFFLGLLCKESTGVLPLVVMAYFLIDRTEGWSQKIKILSIFFIGIAGYMVLRSHFGVTNVHHPGSPQAMILGFITFLCSMITDLRLFILPIDLHYDRSMVLLTSLSEPRAWVTCIFWSVVLLGVVSFYKKTNPFILFLIAWFFIELLPVSQLVASIGVGVGHISTAEHFLYLASIPVFISLVLAFQWAYEQNLRRKFLKESFLKFLAGGFLVFLFLTSVEQSIYASNEYNMVIRSLKIEPMNPRLQGVLAMLSVFRNDIPDAEIHFRAAIKAEPFNPTYHAGLGTALCQQGKWIEGMEQFVAFDPIEKDKSLVERQEKLTMKYLEQQLKQGKTFDARGWLAIGIYHAKNNQSPQAIDAFLKSTQLNPGQIDAWFNLGSIYEASKNWPEARIAYKKLLTLKGISEFQRNFALKHLALMEDK